MSNKKLLGNFSALAVLQFFNSIVPIFVLPLIARVLGVEGFGVVMIVLASIQFMYVITDYGFSLSATYYISKNRDSVDRINDKISRIYSAKILLIIIALLVLIFVSQLPFYSKYSILFYCGVGAIIGQAFQAPWFFQGLERMWQYALLMAITKVVYVVLVFILISNERDAWLVIVSWSIANIFGAICSSWLIKRAGYSFVFSSMKSCIYELKDGALYFWSRLSVSFYTSASSIIVGSIGIGEAAIYSCSEQIYKYGQAFTAPIGQALFPYMAKTKSLKILIYVMPVVIIILSCSSLIVSFFVYFFIKIIFGPEFIEAAPIVNVFLATLVVNYIGVMFGYPACSAIERTDIANKTVLLGGVFFILYVNYIYFFDVINALSIAYAVFFTEFFVMIFRVFWVFSCRDKKSKD